MEGQRVTQLPLVAQDQVPRRDRIRVLEQWRRIPEAPHLTDRLWNLSADAQRVIAPIEVVPDLGTAAADAEIERVRPESHPVEHLAEDFPPRLTVLLEHPLGEQPPEGAGGEEQDVAKGRLGVVVDQPGLERACPEGVLESEIGAVARHLLLAIRVERLHQADTRTELPLVDVLVERPPIAYLERQSRVDHSRIEEAFGRRKRGISAELRVDAALPVRLDRPLGGACSQPREVGRVADLPTHAGSAHPSMGGVLRTSAETDCKLARPQIRRHDVDRPP